MVTLAGIRLSMCTKPQQTAEMNTSYCPARSAPVATADEDDDDFADGDDEEEYMELGGSGGGGCGTLRRPPKSAHALDYADNAVEEVTVSSEQAHLLQHHHHQEQPTRHRHLDILEEVGKHESKYEHVVTTEPDSIRHTG